MPLTARLHIGTALYGERTILQKNFCTQPFKIANITEDKQQKELQLMLMCSSPGVLDDDVYDIEIDVGAGSHLYLQTQSYQRLFQMKTGAVQTTTVRLQEGSFLQYIPHPVVPHQGAIFVASTAIHLQASCSLLWGEVISCGRKLNGEVFRFTSLHSVTSIYRNDRLVVKENLVLKPAATNLLGMGQLEGFTHQATLLFVHEQAPVALLTEELVNLLEKVTGIAFGVSALPVGGLVVRMLGHKAEQLFSLQQLMAPLLKTAIKKSGKKVVEHVG